MRFGSMLPVAMPLLKCGNAPTHQWIRRETLVDENACIQAFYAMKKTADPLGIYLLNGFGELGDTSNSNGEAQLCNVVQQLQ